MGSGQASLQRALRYMEATVVGSGYTVLHITERHTAANVPSTSANVPSWHSAKFLNLGILAECQSWQNAKLAFCQDS
mgnify:CR=1 FL=1